MMWRWALLIYNTNKVGKNKEIYKVGQSILGELLAFAANQLAKVDSPAGRGLNCIIDLLAMHKEALQSSYTFTTSEER